jgi:hypothetical protein
MRFVCQLQVQIAVRNCFQWHMNYGLELASAEVSSAQLMILPDALTHCLYILLFGA